MSNQPAKAATPAKPTVTVSFPEWVISYDEEKHIAVVDDDAFYPHFLGLLSAYYTEQAKKLSGSDKEKKQITSSPLLSLCTDPEILKTCCVESPSQYWLECAYGMMKLEVQRVCQALYQRMPNVIKVKSCLTEDGQKKWQIKKYACLPKEAVAKCAGYATAKGNDSLDVELASKGQHARQHYTEVAGRAAAKTVMKFK